MHLAPFCTNPSKYTLSVLLNEIDVPVDELFCKYLTYTAQKYNIHTYYTEIIHACISAASCTISCRQGHKHGAEWSVSVNRVKR